MKWCDLAAVDSEDDIPEGYDPPMVDYAIIERELENSIAICRPPEDSQHIYALDDAG